LAITNLPCSAVSLR